MGILNYIQGKCKQTAVYWGTPANDGRGKYTFGVEQEVLVRWEDELANFAKDTRSRIQIGKDGKEFRPNCTIYTTVVPTGGWNVDGYLFLGKMADLTSHNPYLVDGAHEIKQIHKMPSLNDPNIILYVIYL